MQVKVVTDEGDVLIYKNARASIILDGRLLVYRPALGGPLVFDCPADRWESLEVTK